MDNFTFKDIDLTGIREDNELYCDFACRRYWANRATKMYLQGRVVWEGRGRTILNTERKNRISKGRVKKDRYNDRLSALRETQGKRTPEEVNVYFRKEKKKFIRACNK